MLPVTITKICTALEATSTVLTFKAQGFKCKRKGFAFMKNNHEILTLEPIDYPKGSIYTSKWKITGEMFNGVRYANKLQDVLNTIK